MQAIDISSFISHHQLPSSYAKMAKKEFFPVAEHIVTSQKQANKPLVLGVSGAQGSGKSTLAEWLVFIFESHYQIKAVSLSIDDFYYTHQERVALDEQIHPLLLTRGVPGTHDVLLAMQTLDSLLQGTQSTLIPRFNKVADDRHPQKLWDIVKDPVDIIIFEGWCLGAEPQEMDDLLLPINELEAKNDAECIWRNHVNQQLHDPYRTLFNTVDLWIMLKAPSFDCVFNWRLEQENKLRVAMSDKQRAMNAIQIKQFIQYYQRITEHLLMTLSNKVDFLFELDERRNIVYSSQF